MLNPHSTMIRSIEPLESRRLLAASLEGDLLHITGTAAADEIRVFASAGDVVARVNRVEHAFARSAVRGLVVDAFRGNDHVEISARLALPATLLGSGGNDTLIGGPAADRLDGGTGDDVLHGTAGDDTLLGSFGDDALNGWQGRDLLISGQGEDSLSGGEGIDTADYAWLTETRRDPVNRLSKLRYGVVVMLHEDQRALASGSVDHIGADVEAIDGSRFRDRMTGNTLANYFRGRAGPDVLRGGGGDDTLIGDSGADQLSGNAGHDHIHAGDGHDLAWGGAGDDYLLGGGGDDQLHGNAGRDSLHGGPGADTLRGNGGVDTLRGGGGDDRANAEDERDRWIDLSPTRA